jgi:hypothetical protein
MKPSISMGAGIYVRLLEMLGQLALFINCILVYYTSKATMKWLQKNKYVGKFFTKKVKGKADEF